MNQLNILFVLCALIISVLAASPPSFCKCTCFTNSTIIPLSTHATMSSPSPLEKSQTRATTCADCNKAFCLEQRLPICKDAQEKDVFTTCFQRDSRKDQIVVLTFIATTVGLLGWAAARKVIEKRSEGVNRVGGPQQGYIAVGGQWQINGIFSSGKLIFTCTWGNWYWYAWEIPRLTRSSKWELLFPKPARQSLE